MQIVWNLLTFFSLSLDFRRRFLSLLSYQFGLFSATLALSVLQNKVFASDQQGGHNACSLLRSLHSCIDSSYFLAEEVILFKYLLIK